AEVSCTSEAETVSKLTRFKSTRSCREARNIIVGIAEPPGGTNTAGTGSSPDSNARSYESGPEKRMTSTSATSCSAFCLAPPASSQTAPDRRTDPSMRSATRKMRRFAAAVPTTPIVTSRRPSRWTAGSTPLAHIRDDSPPATLPDAPDRHLQPALAVDGALASARPHPRVRPATHALRHPAPPTLCAHREYCHAPRPVGATWR